MLTIRVSNPIPTVPAAEIHQRSYLAGGEIIPWAGPVIPVEAPFKIQSKSVKLGCYPDLGPDEALYAVDSAYKAYDRGLGLWPQSSPEFRIEALEKFVSKIIPKRELIVNMLMCETAKTLPDSYKEFDRTIQYINDTIKAYRELIKVDSKPIEFDDGAKAYIDRTPFGTALCMGPFNYPFNETMTSLIPAVIMGNTIVMKPARFGVLFFQPMLEALQESFPPGVVNVVYGDGGKVITPIMQSGKVDVLAFIGSTKVANLVSAAHPEPHRLTKILGLGAHNYSITFAGADIEKIKPELRKGSTGNNGQRCTTLALQFAHEDISDEYAAALADEISKLKPGLPWEDDVGVTHLVEGQWKIDYLHSLRDDALSKGAKIMNEGGGTVLEDNLMVPMVIYPVTPDMKIFHAEQFGPIIPVVKFKDPQEVLRHLADSRFGQQISLFGSDMMELSEVALKARNLVGRVNINSQSQRGPDVLPFAGKKDSGLGVLSVTDALKAFSLPTVIYVKN